ncbi:uncharacterized protein PGTG_00356 [Puccinia graminis f. sp. tritici CRL 75-36-700-3]|uniref:Uncharacterized protein n=1 Tax=Puccinia graminis f. sp. tritici (strain CRL 75-36-700-3 / race SCCL) TaxID=418459 RepID=E3JQL4_PUCGT|nr:uncharacterized protein PGTG_00356 [Puccinia graminis f. sp. tritici CRL 75-36-700-3]EFP74400.2 hypothetical protein PGTG_00356 [Puccinia graminis f. sp. tritici CRL 75-36-700-3]
MTLTQPMDSTPSKNNIITNTLQQQHQQRVDMPEQQQQHCHYNNTSLLQLPRSISHRPSSLSLNTNTSPTTTTTTTTSMPLINQTSSSSNSRRTAPHPTAAPTRTTSNPTNRTLSRKESETDQLAKILAASEEDYRRHQEELERREAEELERVRIESEAAEKLERARFHLLEQTEQAQLELVIQHSQLLQSIQNQGPFTPQNEDEERLAIELAMALSLDSSSPSPSPSPSSSHHHQTIPEPHSPQSSGSPNNTRAQEDIQPELPPSYHSIDEPQEAHDHQPSPSCSSPPYSTLALPQSIPSPASIPPSSNEGSPSPTLSLTPQPSLQSLCPRPTYGRPLPPVPGPHHSPAHHSRRSSSPHPGQSTTPHSSIIIRPPSPNGDSDHQPDGLTDSLAQESDPFSDEFAADQEEPRLPFPSIESQEEEEEEEEEEEDSDEDQEEEEEGEEEGEQEESNGQGSLALTIPCSVPAHTITSSPIEAEEHSRPEAVSRLSSESFRTNPSPPESVAEGVKYGPGHGNSQIEPGPLDVSEAEDSGQGSWRMGMSVVFTETVGDRPNVRLVLELIAGNGESQWSRSEGLARSRRQSSAVLGRRSSVENGRLPSPPVQTIHLPKPYVLLPVKLASLACSLHEIHTVARMSSCSSSHNSLAASLRPSSSTSSSSLSKQSTHSPSNQEIFSRLAKAITSNARLLGEEEATVLQNEERLFRRGKKWLKKTTHKLVGSSSSNSAASSSSALPIHPSSSSSSITALVKSSSAGKHRDNHALTVDGVGLPLPAGATLVQPWESDWN